jgi:maltooligosyltrehalose trehalohydrolase
LLQWHRELISLRKQHPALKNYDRECLSAEILQQDGLILHRADTSCKKELIALFNISANGLTYYLPGNNGTYQKLLDSTEPKWQPENTSTKQSSFPQVLQAGEMVHLPSRSVIILGKEID